MLKKTIFIVSLFSFLILFFYSQAENQTKQKINNLNDHINSIEKETISEDHSNLDIQSHNNNAKPPFWLVLPFIILLVMIATGPLLYEHFWHKYYSYIAVFLALLVTVFYVFKLKNFHVPIASSFEYIQFISLIASLYIASSGIFIKINKRATPKVNLVLLFLGSLLSNFIGTTGASMLLIKPFIRLNHGRLKVYHIIFFIFMISNIGGALTPIGDPPLFLGFLKGVPFFWTVVHNVIPWLFALICLGVIFYILDSRNILKSDFKEKRGPILNTIGRKNFFWLILIIITVFLDPNIFDWVPPISYHGHNHSFLRELILISIGYIAYKNGNKTALKENEFSFEPLKEVIFIFIGIFGTMAPAMELVDNLAQSDYGKSIINHNSLYWGAGTLSSFLDNAPTYLNFLTASMGSHGANISNIVDVKSYAEGNIFSGSILNLKAISISSVFFGAMTYIGNGPNFMVKSIAEKMGVKMPTFFGYLLRYSLLILLPILLVVWLIFFYFNIFQI